MVITRPVSLLLWYWQNLQFHTFPMHPKRSHLPRLPPKLLNLDCLTSPTEFSTELATKPQALRLVKGTLSEFGKMVSYE